MSDPTNVGGVAHRILAEQVIETPQRKLALDVGFVARLRGATPSVKNLVVFKGANTSPVTVTDFREGQPGQVIYVRGDGFMTIQHGTNFVLSSGVNTLLVSGVIYTFTYIDGVWHEAASGTFVPAVGLVRQETVVTTASLADLAEQTGTVALGKSFELFKIEADRFCRVRLYQTAADRTADAARPIGTDPETAAGVIADFNLDVTSGLTLDTQPRISGENHDAPITSTIYYAIQNRSGSSGTVEVTFTHAITET